MGSGNCMYFNIALGLLTARTNCTDQRRPYTRKQCSVTLASQCVHRVSEYSSSRYQCEEDMASGDPKLGVADSWRRSDISSKSKEDETKPTIYHTDTSYYSQVFNVAIQLYRYSQSVWTVYTEWVHLISTVKEDMASGDPKLGVADSWRRSDIPTKSKEDETKPTLYHTDTSYYSQV